jgi:hypothetical protein
MKKHKIWNAICFCSLFRVIVVVVVSEVGGSLEEFLVTEPEPRPFLDVTGRHRSHKNKKNL